MVNRFQKQKVKLGFQKHGVIAKSTLANLLLLENSEKRSIVRALFEIFIKHMFLPQYLEKVSKTVIFFFKFDVS